MAQAPHSPGEAGKNFIDEIVADPKNVPDVTLLYGYLGASSEEGHERLYLSPDLSSYVEIPAKSILHRAQAAKEQDLHGGVTLWVKKDAALQYKMGPAKQALAHYFAGAIQAGAAPAAAPQPTPPQTIFGCTVAPALCPVTVVGTCGIDCSVVCPTHRAPCPTHPPHATCFPNCTNVTPCLVTMAGQVTCALNCTQRSPCPGVSCGIDCTVIRTPCPGASCGIDCSVIGPACQTHHATCAPICTAATPCLPTHAQPQCPFPTEVTCAPVCQASLAPACGPQVSFGACGAGQQPAAAADALRVSAPVSCFMSCFQCNTVFVQCQTIFVQCQVTNTVFPTPCQPVPTPPWTPTPTPTPWQQGQGGLQVAAGMAPAMAVSRVATCAVQCDGDPGGWHSEVPWQCNPHWTLRPQCPWTVRQCW